MIMEGAVLEGAEIFSLSPASVTAFDVVGPNAPITVLFCLNLGKFLNKDFIPAGLKKTSIS